MTANTNVKPTGLAPSDKGTGGKSLTPLRPVYQVDTPPFIHSGRTVPRMMRDTLIALAPVLALAAYHFGIPALRVAALAAGTAVLTEALWQYAADQKCRIYDGTALVSGLLLACILPAGAPWWLVMIGSVLVIVLGKQVFGGLGANPLCPPAVGWAALTISWPLYMDPAAMSLSSDFINPAAVLKYFGPASLPAGDEMGLFLGQQLGGLGSAQIAAVLLGGLYLLARGVIRWEIPAAFLVGVLLTGTIFWFVYPGQYPAPHLYLLTGGTLFAAFFLATDHASSPVGFTGMWLYGLLAGALAVLIRVYGIYPDGAPFAVLLAALVTPLCDLIRPAPYGKRS